MSCHSATANQVRLVLHTAASWLMMHGVRAAIPRGKVTGELIQAPLVWDTPRGLAASASSAGGIVSMSAATLPMPQDASGAMAPSTLRRARRLFPFIEQTKRVSGKIFHCPQPRLKVRCGVRTRTTRYPFLKKLFADGGYQGPEFHTALTKLLPQLETEIIKRSDHAKGLWRFPAVGSSSDHRLAQPLSKASQGLGEPQSQGAGILAPHINPPHAPKLCNPT